MGQKENIKEIGRKAEDQPTERKDSLDPFKDPFLAPRKEDRGPDDLFDGDW